jgi:hypothetical protein
MMPMALPPIEEICPACANADSPFHLCEGARLNAERAAEREVQASEEIAAWQLENPGEIVPLGGWGGPVGFICTCPICHPIVRDGLSGMTYRS